MQDADKKLIRGLKDCSSIFDDASSREQKSEVFKLPEIQVLAVSGPDHDADSLFLNTFFATQLAAPNKECSLISVLSRSSNESAASVPLSIENLGKSILRYGIYWDKLKTLLKSASLGRPEGTLSSRDVFIDFEYRHLLHCEQLMTVLDKWVLLLRPDAESIEEGYKMIKAALGINPYLECYVALEGVVHSAKGELIFERFSELVERYLKTRVNWLGWMNLADPHKHFSSSLEVELLKYQAWASQPSLPRAILANWIEKTQKSCGAKEPQEVRP